MDKDLFNKILQQFPNPYIVNKYYKIKLPNLKGVLYARKTQMRTIYLQQIQQKENKIKISVYRFNKKYDLLFLNDYIFNSTNEKDKEYFDEYQKMIEEWYDV